MKKITAILLIIVMLTVSACGRKQEPVPSESEATAPAASSSETEKHKPTAAEAARHNSAIKPESVRLIQFDDVEPSSETVVFTTSAGEIKIRLFPEEAPETVEAFRNLVTDGYYDGMEFATVMAGYKIETGGKSDSSVFPEEGEFSLNLWNFRGAVALADNGNDFMIVDANQCLNPKSELEELKFPEAVIKKYDEVGGAPHQDWENTVFGQVVEGMNIVDKIAGAKTNDDGKPETPVVIEKAEIQAAASTADESSGEAQ